MTLIFNLHKVI